MAPKATSAPTAPKERKRLHFSQRELESAFRRFVNISKPNNNSSPIDKDFLLYSIYAVECGLKALLVGKGGTTKKLDDECFTHDINFLLEKVPVFQRTHRLRPMQGKCNGEKRGISPHQLHELYRYGGQLESRSQADLIGNLTKLCEEIAHQLRT